MTRGQTLIEVYRFTAVAQIWPIALPHAWRLDTIDGETRPPIASIRLGFTRTQASAQEDIVFGLVPRCIEGIPDGWFFELATNTAGLRLSLQFHDAAWHLWQIDFLLPNSRNWSRCTSTAPRIVATPSDASGSPSAPDSPIQLGRLVIQPPQGTTQFKLGLRSMAVLGDGVRLMAAGHA